MEAFSHLAAKRAGLALRYLMADVRALAMPHTFVSRRYVFGSAENKVGFCLRCCITVHVMRYSLNAFDFLVTPTGTTLCAAHFLPSRILHSFVRSLVFRSDINYSVCECVAGHCCALTASLALLRRSFRCLDCTFCHSSGVGPYSYALRSAFTMENNDDDWRRPRQRQHHQS